MHRPLYIRIRLFHADRDAIRIAAFIKGITAQYKKFAASHARLYAAHQTIGLK